MSSILKAFALVLFLSPASAFTAPAKKKAVTPTPAAVAASDDTLVSSMGTGGSTIPEVFRKHLSVSAKYDFADEIEVTDGDDLESERSIILGLQYEFDQFTKGLAVQVGGTYDVNREVKNSDGLKLQEWTTYGELVAKVTPGFKVMGGLNYNFPSLSGAASGVSIKGKIGYQFGGSYLVAPQIALEGSYRQLEMDVSESNERGGKSSRGIKVSGFMFGGRYTF